MTLPADTALSAHYIVTVLRDAPHPGGAIAFVAFLFGPGWGKPSCENTGWKRTTLWQAAIRGSYQR